MAAGGLLTRIGIQESGMGKASNRIYGEIPGTFYEDMIGLAGEDPAVAAMIKGKTRAQIEAMETRDNADLQKKTAAWHLRNVVLPIMANDHMQMNDLSAYAVWHFEHHGAHLMNSPDSASLDTVLTPAELSANPEYRGKTVGWWKKRFGASFPEGSFGSTPNMFDRPPATQHVVVTPGGPIKVQVQNGKGTVQSQHDVGWHATPGQPIPSGVPGMINGW
jgi:hypothetical protein